MLAMPSDSACHHPHYPPQRNRIRTWQGPGTLKYTSQPPASWEVGNFQQHSTDAAPIYIFSSAPAALASPQCVTASITCLENVSAVLPQPDTTGLCYGYAVMDIATVFRSSYQGKRICYQGLWTQLGLTM